MCKISDAQRGDHPRSHPEPVRGLQAHPDQAVPQRREGAADRDHDQRHHRLFDRQTADQSARTARDRLLRQQAPAARPITQPRPDHRRRRPAHRHRADHHRNRHPHPRAAAGQQRSHALLAALPLFRLQPDGFANKDLRALTAELRGLDPATVTAGQITYDLRRLRVRGLITRIPHTHRYRLTEHGLHTAMFISAVHDRFLPTGLAQLADELTSPPLRAHPAPTAMPSITLPAQQVWPPNTHSRSQHTKLDSKFRLRRI